MADTLECQNWKKGENGGSGQKKEGRFAVRDGRVYAPGTVERESRGGAINSRSSYDTRYNPRAPSEGRNLLNGGKLGKARNTEKTIVTGGKGRRGGAQPVYYT